MKAGRIGDIGDTLATEFRSDYRRVAGVAAVATETDKPLREFTSAIGDGRLDDFLHGVICFTGDSGDTGDSLESVRVFCRQLINRSGDNSIKWRQLSRSSS